MTPSRTTDANLDRVFVENSLLFVALIKIGRARPLGRNPRVKSYLHLIHGAGGTVYL